MVVIPSTISMMVMFVDGFTTKTDRITSPRIIINRRLPPPPLPHYKKPDHLRLNAAATRTTIINNNNDTSSAAATIDQNKNSVPPSLSSSPSALSPISLSLEELSEILDGSGKAKACWDCFRVGVDPVWYFSGENPKHHDEEDYAVNNHDFPVSFKNNKDLGDLNEWTREEIEEYMITTGSSRKVPNVLGKKSVRRLKYVFGGSIENQIATLSNITTSQDGATKLLMQLQSDGMMVETVIIPWEDRHKSSICVSSQVGCRQACTFCSTGRMGLLRNLSSCEILAQLYWANKVCRLRSIYPIDNCVFMGMGEPADNVSAVVRAASIMVDRNLFGLAPSRVTISTVGPSPESFIELGDAPVVLAWSVHSSREDVRKQLVPTSKFTMEQLRQGLITALQKRQSKRLRNIMLEVALLDQINDSEDDAEHLAEFCRPLLEHVDGIRLFVNLIPWNDISASFGPASAYRKPHMERILSYQKVLIDKGILSYIRTTRGDEEDAACGMLSTKNNKRNSDP
jgi:23S rRNA (adenine2503-C2)-methyltransferase